MRVRTSCSALADRPRPRGGPSAVKSSNPPETNIVSGTILRLACGPSAPHERTVRSLTFQPKPEKQHLWYKFEISRRTVRAPWPDCPPFNFEAQTRETTSLVQN